MRYHRLTSPTASATLLPRIATAPNKITQTLFALLIALLLLVSGCTPATDDSQDGTPEGDEIAVTGDDTSTPGNDAGDVTDQTTSGYTVIAGDSIAAKISALSIIPDGLTVTDFVVVSIRRTGFTTKEYVLRLKISNSSSESFRDVQATLLNAPPHVVIVDEIATVGDVPANSTILSLDTFTVDVDLALSTSFDDFLWQIEGDIKPPPPPPPSTGKPASSGIFMKIDGLSIKGESTSDSHRDWIVLDRVMDGLHREGLQAGATRGRSNFVFDGLQVIKSLDLSTVKLREAVVAGTIFTDVQIDIVKRCGENFYTAFAITLTIARIESLAMQGGTEDRPIEEVGFNYTRIQTMYTPVNPDCSLDSPVYSTQDGNLLDL